MSYKKVIITLPKGLTRTSPNILATSIGESTKSTPKLNFTTSTILLDKKLPTAVNGIFIKQEVEDEQQHQEQLQEQPKSKKRRLDHLTWEEKLQRK